MVCFVSLHFCLLHVRSIAELFHASLTLRTTWNVEPGNSGTLELKTPKILEPSNLGNLHSSGPEANFAPWRCNLETMESSRTLLIPEFWNIGVMEACNFGFLKHCNLGTAPRDNCRLGWNSVLAIDEFKDLRRTPAAPKARREQLLGLVGASLEVDAKHRAEFTSHPACI